MWGCTSGCYFQADFWLREMLYGNSSHLLTLGPFERAGRENPQFRQAL